VDSAEAGVIASHSVAKLALRAFCDVEVPPYGVLRSCTILDPDDPSCLARYTGGKPTRGRKSPFGLFGDSPIDPLKLETLAVPDATLASGGVYSAFAVGTVFADSLNVLLVQDNAGTSASMEELPESGGVGTWVVLSGALALISCGIGAIPLVRRSVTW
jgi:hypothetical protein